MFHLLVLNYPAVLNFSNNQMFKQILVKFYTCKKPQILNFLHSRFGGFKIFFIFLTLISFIGIRKDIQNNEYTTPEKLPMETLDDFIIDNSILFCEK